VIDTWTHANNDVADAMVRHLERSKEGYNPVYMMMTSGARGNRDQMRQLAGMRGLMAKPQKKLTGGIGEIIESPIKSNFREGLTVVEYFISTHGARKGLADTALKTADAGYLTRRLVDVAQDVVVTVEDCGTILGLEMTALKEGEDIIEPLKDRIVGIVALEDVYDPIDGELLVSAGELIVEEIADAIEDAGIQSVKIRSVLTCEAKRGICRQCYGRNLATMKMVDIGEAVGILAAQSIGEAYESQPSKNGQQQLIDLFEAQHPEDPCVVSEIDGRVSFGDIERGKREVVVTPETGPTRSYDVPVGKLMRVHEGDHVRAGDRLSEGPINPHDILRIKGPRAVQEYLLNEIQEVYRLQGVKINDKHIGVIVRQMLALRRIADSGGSEMAPGHLVTREQLQLIEQRMAFEGRPPPKTDPVVTGVSEASRIDQSFLVSAASQPTLDFLMNAALNGARDPLDGMTSNVILGRLIPFGTGVFATQDVAFERDPLKG
ncbi:DNA-directed RNA polymerase subunit beta', partial [Gemmatimonadota bacterium CCK-12]